MPNSPSTPAFAEHNHDQCIREALDRAAELCRHRGVRLTEQRRRVLELIWSGHRPAGAYNLLEQLREEGHRAAPPTIYRALDFLLEQGLVHRIEGLNAYVGCIHPEQGHRAQFLICDQCRRVAEISDQEVSAAIRATSADLDFQPARLTVEVHGTCASCRGADDND